MGIALKEIVEAAVLLHDVDDVRDFADAEVVRGVQDALDGQGTLGEIRTASDGQCHRREDGCARDRRHLTRNPARSTRFSTDS